MEISEPVVYGEQYQELGNRSFAITAGEATCVSCKPPPSVHPLVCTSVH